MSEQSIDINWLQEIEDVPRRAIDPLAEEVMNRYNAAVSWMSTEVVNGRPLRQVLEDCYNQQQGIISCLDKQRAEELGVDATVNITALKTGIANAYLNDTLISGTSELPWIITPTPRPDISPTAQDEVLEEIKAELFMGVIPSGPAMVELIRQAKRVRKRREDEKAVKSAREMMLLMEDQCAEGGFHKAMTDFLQYFPVYPFAVFVGPQITRAPRMVWGRRKPRLSTEVFPTFRAVSPFDFAYSPDSPDTQRGTCVFVRSRWTRKELIDASQMKAYLRQNIIEVLTEADTDASFTSFFLSREPNSSHRSLALWKSNVEQIEVLTHYGYMSGRELGKYGFTHLEDLEFYNCEISMVGYRVIQVKVYSDPRFQIRPVNTASFYRTGGDCIAGDGIAQRLRDVERAYQACLMYLMRNAANASAPLCEADYRRLSKYMSDEDLGQVVPGTMYLADADVANSNAPALRFFNIPSNMPAYTQLMEMFMQLADRITNIPAALHGEAVGSGAMRTFRGMSMLQGNATRALHAAVDNLSNGVFLPMGELLFNLNMLYAKDESIKGDSQIIAKGAKGILANELERQTAMELLQVVAPLGNVMNVAPVIGWGVQKLIAGMGVPDDIVEQIGAAPAPPPGMPNPNPMPDSPDGMGPQLDTMGVGNA